MKSLYQYTVIVLLAILCLPNLMVAGQDSNSSPPRNLRITRENVGASEEQFTARWDAPTGDAPDYYSLAWRWRESSDEEWNAWQSGYIIHETTFLVTYLANLGLEEGVVPQLQVGAKSFTSEEFSDEVFASFPPQSRRSRSVQNSDSSDDESRREPDPIPPTCETLSADGEGITVSSPNGMGSGIECQHIDGGGIGIDAILQMGYIDAVDVWGIVTEATVCFGHESGAFIFLDAATAPRTASWVEGFDMGELMCVTIDRPGSIVLMPLHHRPTV